MLALGTVPRRPGADALRASSWAPTQALAVNANYQIYPKPHELTYANTTQVLRSEANVVVEKNIDSDTRARLDEALKLMGITAKPVDAVPEGGYQLNVLVGIKGSGGAVDSYVQKLVDSGKR